jgi:hypothetical protein
MGLESRPYELCPEIPVPYLYQSKVKGLLICIVLYHGSHAVLFIVVKIIAQDLPICVASFFFRFGFFNLFDTVVNEHLVQTGLLNLLCGVVPSEKLVCMQAI